jgi:hypothetical protein
MLNAEYKLWSSSLNYLLQPPSISPPSGPNIPLSNPFSNFFCSSTALVGLGRSFSYLIYTQSVGLLGRVISPSQGRYLHTGRHKQKKRTQTSMPWVGFESTIPAFERAKTVHALDRAATAIGLFSNTVYDLPLMWQTKFHTLTAPEAKLLLL